MKFYRMFVITACMLGTATVSVAGTVSARLVEASKSETPIVSPGLEDIVPMLKGQLRYNSFALKGSRNHPWQNGTGLALGAGYEMDLSGVEGAKATVELKRGRRLVKMRVTLERGRPLCLGPLSSGDGKALIVVLTLRD